MTREPLAERLALYLVADFGARPEVAVTDATEAALRGGVTTVQYRDKTTTEAEVKRRRAALLRDLTRRYDALFIVNDDVTLALACQADGVHVGPRDEHPAAIRPRVPSAFLIGASAGTLERARRCRDGGADYLGVGAIYSAGPSKPDASPPKGCAVLRTLRSEIDLPLVAIGGIDQTNAATTAAAGADGIAVIRAVLDAPDAYGAARALGAAFSSGRADRTKQDIEAVRCSTS